MGMKTTVIARNATRKRHRLHVRIGRLCSGERGDEYMLNLSFTSKYVVQNEKKTPVTDAVPCPHMSATKS